ncbi:MAG: hypothetical protein AUJ18_03230 [Candidatus Hydrogenedentes bacterium CG1_02_42_14]|nr:MAG: hypothetical protein AUJ18_03230 [Candidatus Hydrogenedentes bacterium CG1_02_42_14]
MRTAVLNEIKVESAPGIPQLFSISDFCRGVNVIVGKNASGKTTTIRAIQSTLWPDRKNVFRATSVWKIDSDEWRLTVQGKNRFCYSNEQQCEPDWIPSIENSQIYFISLLELLSEKERGEKFAIKIQRELCGGVDFSEISEKFNLDTKKQYKNEKNNLKSAKDELKKLWADAKNKEKQEKELSRLEKETAELQIKIDSAKKVQAVLEYIESKQLLDSKDKQLRAYPEFLRRMNNEDAARIIELRRRIDELEREIDSDSESEMILRKESEICGLTHEEIERNLDDTRRRIANLKILQKELDEQKNKLSSIRGVEKKAVEDLSEMGVNSERSRDISYCGKLENLLERIEAFRTRKNEISARINELERESTSTSQESEMERTARAVIILREWLRNSKNENPWYKWALIFYGLTIIDYFKRSVALTAIIIFVIAALVFCVLAVEHLLRISRKKTYCQIKMSEFSELKLEPLTDWSFENVELRLSELEMKLDNIRWQEKIIEKRKSLSIDLDSLIEEEIKLKSEMLKFKDAAGINSSVPEINLLSISRALTASQSSRIDIAGIESLMNKIAVSIESELNLINEGFKLIGGREVSDAISGETEFEFLFRRFRSAGESLNKAEKLLQKLNISRRELAEKKNERAGIIQRIVENVSGIDENAILQAAEKLKEFSKVAKERDEAKFSADSKREKPDSLELNRIDRMEKDELQKYEKELQERCGLLKELTEEREKKLAQISGIQALIEDAKNKDTIECALEKRDEALRQVRRAADEEMWRSAANIFIEKVKRDISEVSLPRVARMSNEIFETVTAGRFSAVFPIGISEEIRAAEISQDRNIEKKLDELSSATRLQLLLSVRMAFLEESGQSYSLPAFFDETLANSDEDRIKKIAELVAVISKRGHQVFYFTAREEEEKILSEECMKVGTDYRRFELNYICHRDEAIS